MEQNNNINRSDLWGRIYNIVKKLPRKDIIGDAPDVPSITTELEYFFKKIFLENTENTSINN